MTKYNRGKLVFGSKLAELWFNHTPCWLYNLFPVRIKTNEEDLAVEQEGFDHPIASNPTL